MNACARNTCCTDNPGAYPTNACFNIGACGCRVVEHPAHPTVAIRPIEGVVVDDEAGIERFCEAVIETTTEFDWCPDSENSLPEHLREGLRRWVREFRAWDRGAQ